LFAALAEKWRIIPAANLPTRAEVFATEITLLSDPAIVYDHLGALLTNVFCTISTKPVVDNAF
jgi:hypothetical protein